MQRVRAVSAAPVFSAIRFYDVFVTEMLSPRNFLSQ